MLHAKKPRIKRLVFILILTSTFIAIFILNQSTSYFNINFRKDGHLRKLTYKIKPGLFLEAYKPGNASYCGEYNYGLPQNFIFDDNDFGLPYELQFNSSYRVLYNVLRGKWNSGNVPNVTYATHITADFINFVPEIVRTWEGPINVAAFVPSTDVNIILTQLQTFCFCLPGMSRLTLHFVFPKYIPPKPQDLPASKVITNCSIRLINVKRTYRTSNNIIYPINVCRNVARNTALTYFVMVSDIELIPSQSLASRFINMTFYHSLNPPTVYVVPVFEVEEFYSIPRTKKELTEMVHAEKAIYFHRKVCSHCQKFPGIETWLNSRSAGDRIRLFASAKREYPYHRWEPIFIGSKNEPLYNEILSWEGLQDKMVQMLEMCLLGYRFTILDGAFLVHWPGIKKKETHTTKNWRIYYKIKNSKEYGNILKVFYKKYKNINPHCKIK